MVRRCATRGYLLRVINETRERFLRAILERIPVERIVEVHFFPAIRQGQVETGVAVIAATPLAAQRPAERDVPAPDPEAVAAADAARTEVLTAAYRWTRKGPERGTWAVDIVAEADAPIATVGTVVRGVQERAGEALDAHRMTAAELRELLATDLAFALPRAPSAPEVVAA